MNRILLSCFFMQNVFFIFADHTLVLLYILLWRLCLAMFIWYMDCFFVDWLMSTTIERTTMFIPTSIPAFVYGNRGCCCCCCFGCCFGCCLRQWIDIPKPSIVLIGNTTWFQGDDFFTFGMMLIGQTPCCRRRVAVIRGGGGGGSIHILSQ